MYMRMVHMKVREGKLEHLQRHYSQRVIPALSKVEGCLYAGLMHSSNHEPQCISMTLWSTELDGLTYESGGLFQVLLSELRPFLSESSESRLQLSEDLTLEYVSVPEDPVVEHYSVEESAETPTFKDKTPQGLWLRIVALKIADGKLDEFKSIYRNTVLPTLRKLRGCRYVFLTQNAGRKNDVISVTVWDSKQDAEAYERGKMFPELLNSTKHTLAGLFQWRLQQNREEGPTATSEDPVVESYDVLAGKSFA